jgi:hypothetical protein
MKPGDKPLLHIPQPPPPKSPQSAPPVKGRFIGLEATGKELYRVVMLETVDGKVVRTEVLEPGRPETRDGREIRGASIAVALHAFNLAVSKRLHNASDLWKP